MLHLDFTQLSRALHHLVDNALEYSEGPVTIGARADQALVLWVEDSGPGIPESEKSAVFDKFFRGRSGRASHSSTGLGLAIAREIIRANQGDIGIEDAHPQGTRLLLTLPLENQS
jgi:signal transduction histidine kinase